MNKMKVSIMSGVSIDGKLSLKRGITSGSINGYLSQACMVELHRWRGIFNAILVGGTTVAIDNPSLTARYPGATNPIRVIIGPEGNVPLSSKVFDVTEADTILAVTSKTDKQYVEAVKEKGVDVFVAGDGDYVNYKDLLNYLENKGIKHLMVEGGGTINWLMLEQGLVDDIYIFTVPIVTGAVSAPTFVEGPAGKEMEDPVVLEWVDGKNLDGVPFNHYLVKK